MARDRLVIVSEPEYTEQSQKKFQWYWAPIYCAAWFVLFYAVVIPSFRSYPKTLLIRDEHKHHSEFIGERAQAQLFTLNNIGIKLTGTIENEVYTINFLLAEIEKAKASARHDLYDIDVDVQYSTGNFMLWTMAASYHNVSNVIVKLSPKNTRSDSYLLVNSHFDSEVGSPGAADDGVMVVIMLETLRVIAKSEKPLNNPIVFLFNGAEEAGLMASHGFITQHKWAPNCKALINLDSSGGGGREILFQTGPDHPWLVKYYKQSIPHPYASTVAEELFQNNFVPSDTDFRIFRDYKGVPGLDMAHSFNGYIYHTKYDNFYNLERGTYQTTGDNVLALTWALANAEELRNPEAHAEGHSIFFDYLGWFLVTYAESTGIALNITFSICTLIAISLSVFLMTRDKSADAPKQVYLRFLIIVLVQIITVAAGFGITILVGVIMHALGLSISWYYEKWLIFGLYFCPSFFVLGMCQALFMRFTKLKTNMYLDDTIACFMHSHCIILILACLIMTGLGIRSAYFTMIAIFFYGTSVILNIIARITIKGKSFFLVIHLPCQVLPFWFYTYIAYFAYDTFVPMQGRDGPMSKPEFLVAGFAVVISTHFTGFILPIFHKFRKTKTIFSIFGVLLIVFIIIAATPAGFPFKRDVAPQRFYVLHTNRIIHGYNKNEVLRNESGFYVQPVDTRSNTLDDTTFKNALPQSWTDEACSTEVLCGLPLYNSRWLDWKSSTRWIPASQPNLPIQKELQLVSKEYLTDTKLRYEFLLKSADRVVIFIEPYPNTKVLDWSFDLTPITENYKPPYFINHIYSLSTDPFRFWFVIELNSANDDGPIVRMGIGEHFQYHRHTYTDEYKAFLQSFPDWTYSTHWVASFESWLF